MQKYPLQDLMRVREFREDRAATQVKTQRARVKQAEDILRTKRAELEKYIQWRIRREREMYDEIMNQVILMKELGDLKESVQILKANEASYQDAVLQAEKKLEEEKSQLLLDIQTHRAAQKSIDKLVEHRSIWQAEVDQETEANQEKELEDFRIREREDDYAATEE